MGCDIHLALERKLINKNKKYYKWVPSESGKWDKLELETNPWEIAFYSEGWHGCPMFAHATHGERIYGMFSELAGVRGEWKGVYPEPKGLPEDVTRQILFDYTWEVNDASAKFCKEHDCDWHAVTEEEAKKLIEEYHCKEYKFKHGVDKDGNDVYERRIENPDWHSASWATREELEKAFNKVFVHDYEGEPVMTGDYIYYLGLINLMKTFEEDGDFEVRMVYWFDN